MTSLYYFLSGATMMASWVVALFFCKFWKKSADRLFGIFALSFGIMGFERLILAFMEREEGSPFPYILRLSAFILIIYGIIDKNRREVRG